MVDQALRIRQIEALLDTEMSIAEVASSLGLTRDALYKWLDYNGYDVKTTLNRRLKRRCLKKRQPTN